MNRLWTPKLGDTVWFNHPDSDEPEGVVVGFVAQDAAERAGQPIIEVQADEPPPFGRKKRGGVVTHPMFLLPLRFGGPEWLQAQSEGRIRG